VEIEVNALTALIGGLILANLGAVVKDIVEQLGLTENKK
jgi:hypothetical protein